MRSSASRSYLHPAIKATGRIKLETRALVHRIIFDKKTALGIEYSIDGVVRKAYASGEVILSAGAVNSPQILKRSGVGPSRELLELDIPVVADIPGVGENLQDHLDYLVQYHCTQDISLYPATRPIGKLRVGMEWMLFKTGVGASNVWETGSFFRSRPDIDYPNLQHHFAPIALSYDGAERIKGHGFQVHLSQMRPRSRGWVRLRDRNPTSPPRILFNHLADADDRQEIRDGIRVTRELVRQAAFDKFRGEEIAPGGRSVSDSDLDAYARAKAETSHHPSCTCKMGSDDMSVVDTQGRVHGLNRLRVVDASIMPDIVTANLNASTLMMAEKIADDIRGRECLPAEHADYFGRRAAANA